MLGELTNHLWQSTLFAIAAGILTAAFRNNRAQVRYWLWFSASLKFLVTFSLLTGLGSHLQWMPAANKIAAPAVSVAVLQVAQPFPKTAVFAPSMPNGIDCVPTALLAVWACGFGMIALIRFRGWRCIRSAVRTSAPFAIPAPVEVRSSPGLLAPGVVGLFRPILLLPSGIRERLNPVQLEAVIAHELCHIRRRDNLRSAIHMIVEAIFWFHPLVWWIGARLIEERERACDEEVLRLGNDPREYAEGILNVYRSYLESRLAFVSGVTGSNLKKRIQAILTGRIARELTFTKKLALAATAIAALGAPIVVGVLSAPGIEAQSQLAAPEFATVSITPCEAFHGRRVRDLSPGRLRSECTTVQRFIQQAYGLFADGHANLLSSVTVTGGPAWTKSALYEIDAKADGPQSQPMMNGPMLQRLLEDRFKLKIHRETREVPVYDLTVDEGNPRLQPFEGNCVPLEFDRPNPESFSAPCATARPIGTGVGMNGWIMADLRAFFLVTLDRPVVDKTGLTGRFNFHLELSDQALGLLHQPHILPALGNPAAPATGSSFTSAMKTALKKLGLNLEPAMGPGEFLVIDGIERPSEN